MKNLDKLKELLKYLIENDIQRENMDIDLYKKIYKRKVMKKENEKVEIDWVKLNVYLDQMIEDAGDDLLFLQDFILEVKMREGNEKVHSDLLNSYNEEVYGLTKVLQTAVLEEKYEIAEKCKIVINNEIDDLNKLIKNYFPDDIKEEAEEELKLIKHEYNHMMKSFLSKFFV